MHISSATLDSTSTAISHVNARFAWTKQKKMFISYVRDPLMYKVADTMM